MPAEGARVTSVRILSLAGLCLLPLSEAAAQAVTRAGEVIVTGRGRSEAAFAAPTAVTVITSAGLEARGVASVDDLAVAAPGLHVINDQDPGTNIVSLRGVTTDRLQQAAVAFVLDDVPLADTEFFTARLPDLQRAEIYRGPQGALFGKSAAGGALALSTGAATGVLSVSARAGIGNGGAREAELIGDAPVPGLAGWGMRGAFHWSAADGWIKNRTLGRVVDATESKIVRLGLAGRLFDALSLDGRLFWLEEDGGAAWASSNNVFGRFGGVLDGAALTDPIGDFEGRAWRRWFQASGRARLALPGGGEIRAVAARDSYQKRWVEELDYRPGPLTFFGFPAFPQGLQPIRQPTDLQVWTGELRYVSPANARLRWTAGAFVQDVTRTRVDDFGPLLFGAPPARYVTDSLQTAAFAGLSYDLAETLTLEAQARIDRDERTQTITAATTGARIDRRSADFTEPQPRLALSWRPSRSLTIYGSYAEGFRTGGFNPIPGPGSIWRARFEPEVAKSIEFGAKFRDLPGDGRLEASIFRTRTDDFQSYTFLDGNSVTLSVDEAQTLGVEIAGGFRPAPGWIVEGAFAFADAEVVRYVAPDPLIAGRTRDYSGKQIPNAPLWTATAGVQRVFIAGPVRLTLRADLNATGKTVYEIDNALTSPAKAWLDLKADAARGPWMLTLWAKNVSDERWAISAFGQNMLPLLAGLGPNGPFDTFTLNRGRQWGVRAGVRY
jgi:iron complex outermembrane recepter protein